MVGGLVGGNSGVIQTSHASGRIRSHSSGQNEGYGGGLVGWNVGSIIQSFATGDVQDFNVRNPYENVGGLVGSSWDGAISQSYATGAVSAANANTGGLIGFHAGELRQAYSTGAVNVAPGSQAFVGGLIGADSSSPDNLAAYWDLDTSGISDPAQGAGNVQNDPGITGLTDAQLKAELPDGFDPAIWGQSPEINNGYPYLLANPPDGAAPKKERRYSSSARAMILPTRP